MRIKLICSHENGEIDGHIPSTRVLIEQKSIDKDLRAPVPQSEGGKLTPSYLSIDHLKMGLIRSGNTSLTPEDDDALTDYLWPIVREIIKTAIENGQHLIVERGRTNLGMCKIIPMVLA